MGPGLPSRKVTVMNQWIQNAIKASGRECEISGEGDFGANLFQVAINTTKEAASIDMGQSLIPPEVRESINRKAKAGTPLSGYETQLMAKEQERIKGVVTQHYKEKTSKEKADKALPSIKAQTKVSIKAGANEFEKQFPTIAGDFGTLTRVLNQMNPQVIAELKARGWFPKKKRSWLSKVGGAIGDGFKAAGKVATAPLDVATDVLEEIPVLGGPLSTLTSAGSELVNTPFSVAGQVVQGKPIDKAIINEFKKDLSAAKTVVVYVQVVVSFVPGVGQGLSGVIGASVALAEGKRITEALVEGVKSSLPGGPITAAALDVAMAAAQGKPIDEIAINIIPIPKSQKDLLIRAAKVAKDVAAGKKVEAIAYEQVMQQLPSKLQDGIAAGIALGGAKLLQANNDKDVPKALPKLKDIGDIIADDTPVLKAGLSRIKDADQQSGFKIGVGASKYIVSPYQFQVMRGKLSPKQKLGFDIAMSEHVGNLTRKKPKKKEDPQTRFRRNVAKGLEGAEKKQKEQVSRSLAYKPQDIVVILPPQQSFLDWAVSGISSTLKEVFT